MRLRIAVLTAALVGVAGAILLGCTLDNPLSTGVAPSTQPTVADVPLAGRLVWSGSYVQDIQPIFDQYCTSCHSASRAENGLRLDSYQGTIKGTQFGPVVTPGSPGFSTLAAVIQGTADPKIRMPHEGRKLTRNRIQNILLWIEAGTPND